MRNDTQKLGKGNLRLLRREREIAALRELAEGTIPATPIDFGELTLERFRQHEIGHLPGDPIDVSGGSKVAKAMSRIYRKLKSLPNLA